MGIGSWTVGVSPPDTWSVVLEESSFPGCCWEPLCCCGGGSGQLRDIWPVLRQFKHTPVKGLRPLRGLAGSSRPSSSSPCFSCSTCLVSLSTAQVSSATCPTTATVSASVPPTESTAESDWGERYDSISNVAVTASSSVDGCFWRH